MLFILCDLFMEEFNYNTTSVRKTMFLSALLMLGEPKEKKKIEMALKRYSYCAVTDLSPDLDFGVHVSHMSGTPILNKY